MIINWYPSNGGDTNDDKFTRTAKYTKSYEY